jgi:hypothetical protein
MTPVRSAALQRRNSATSCDVKACLSLAVAAPNVNVTDSTDVHLFIEPGIITETRKKVA